jgi:hypothetical protein
MCPLCGYGTNGSQVLGRAVLFFFAHRPLLFGDCHILMGAFVGALRELAQN